MNLYLSELSSYSPGHHGIYRILNLTNGKFYIGSAVCLKNRASKHFSDLRKGKHGNRKLQNSFNKHGESAFVFHVIEPVIAKELLIQREQFYIDTLRPELNIRKIADSPLGLRATPETRRRQSEAHRGAKNPMFGLKGADNPLFGRKQPAHLKRLWSEQRKGEKNPMFGISPSHAKLTPDAVRYIRTMIREGHPYKFIADLLGITTLNVSQIKCGRVYAGVVD